MGRGKTAAQAGHAVLDTFVTASQMRPETIPPYKTNHGIKICLLVPTLEKLEKALAQAQEAGLPAALITDFGYTVFEGVPTITAVGIGPAKKSEVPFLKKFQLCK